MTIDPDILRPTASVGRAASVQEAIEAVITQTNGHDGDIAAIEDDITEIGLPSSHVVASPARTLGAAFRPSPMRETLCVYSVRVAAALTVGGGQLARVELRSDAANPPTTVRGRAAGGLTGTVVIGVSINGVFESSLAYLVPAGHYVLLQVVNETGSPTVTLQQSTEVAL